MNSVILIPAYEPDEKLINLINEISGLPFYNIIIVNDGSSKKCACIFDEIRDKFDCIIINHSENKGKGIALKTGMREILKMDNKVIGCITVDADGQHLPKDILKIGEVFENNNHSLIVGCRDFQSEKVPIKNKIGNLITRDIFKFATGKYISDTQTGLRAIPREAMDGFCELLGDRYELEMNMLMDAAKKDMDIKEVPIDTVYIDDNRSSHFNKLTDSFKIYREILKFCFSFLFCSMLDLILYITLFVFFSQFTILPRIFIAVLLARVISKTFYFVMDKNDYLFDKGIIDIEFLKYAFAVFSQIIMSFFILYGLYLLGVKQVLLSKILAEFIIFIVLYLFKNFITTFNMSKQWQNVFRYF